MVTRSSVDRSSCFQLSRSRLIFTLLPPFLHSGAAQCIFPYQHIERWAFDVELLFLGNRQHVPMTEVPVEWQEIDGSKVDMLADTLNMARDLIMIRLCYLFRLWTYVPGPAKRPVTKPSKSD